MKGNTIFSLQKVSVIFLAIVIIIVFQSIAFGKELSSVQKDVWQTVESYWKTWKEKTVSNLRSFYQKDYVHWAANSTWPHSSSLGDPPAGYIDGLGDVIDSYDLTLHEVRVWGNVAITMYNINVIHLGKENRLQCTDTWMKEADKWQLIGSMRNSCSTLPSCP